MNDTPLDPVNRLVEFGLDMAIAQRMVSNMNAAMQSAWTPGAPTRSPLALYVALEGRRAGPFNDDEVTRFIVEGRMDASTLVWRVGMGGRAAAREVPEVMRLAALCPPQLPKER